MFGGDLRLGELLGLQRDDFDQEAGTLHVERQQVVKNEVLTTGTKTGQARTVTLPPSTRALFADHLASTPGARQEPDVR